MSGNYEAVGKVVQDVWMHSKPTTSPDTRDKVLKKGREYRVYGIVNNMYDVGSGYVYKKYIKIVEGHVTAEKTKSSSSGSSSSGLMSGGFDWMVAVGAGFMLLLLVGDLIKK